MFRAPKQLDVAYSPRRYIYVYASTCRHGELTRINYCDRATALGLPRLYVLTMSRADAFDTNTRSDDHSPASASADNSRSRYPGPSSSHQPASSATKNSSSGLHSQSQHNNSMSTINLSNTGRPHPHDAVVGQQDGPLPQAVAFTPRSTLSDIPHTGIINSSGDASSLLGIQGFQNLSIDIPFRDQSSFSKEVAQDGKVTELVARFESYTIRSDALKVLYESSNYTCSLTTQRPSDSDAETVCGLSDKHFPSHTEAHPIGYMTQGSQSPRKTLPAPWLPRGTGPTLATAQRARERSHKRGSQSGSPIEVKTIRGTRSSIDLSRLHGVENTTFLTKEALAAVENNVASPATARNSAKLHQLPSKPAWHSPATSPLRSSPGQNSAFTIRMPPSRPSFVNAKSTTTNHSKTPSSIATSTGEYSFHIAEGSPVRSLAGTEISFQSAAEVLDKTGIPHLDLNANGYIAQPTEDFDRSNLLRRKAVTESRSSQKKPKLALDIPASNLRWDAGPKSAASIALATSSRTVDMSPRTPESPHSSSRIPRIVGTCKTGKIYNATRSSTLMRAQSGRALGLRVKSPQDQVIEPSQVPLPSTPAVASPRHVRTVNSSGTTPTLSRSSVVAEDPISGGPSQDLTNNGRPTHSVPTMVDQIASRLAKKDMSSPLEHPALSDGSIRGQMSRATSIATVKGFSSSHDPVSIDSAIIYSRKKSDDFGTNLDCPVNTFSHVFMMAHNLNIGNLHQHDTQIEVASAVPDNATSVRGRSEWIVPNERRQEESEHSLQSSLGSDLRATAAEFVPHAPLVPSDNTSEENIRATLFPTDIEGVDKNGIPWFCYMDPISFAYNQGFYYGRSKSPRKFKPKKQRVIASSLVNNSQSPSLTNHPSSRLQPNNIPVSDLARRQTSSELMPPPPRPENRHQKSGKQENDKPGPGIHTPEIFSSTGVSVDPFASQLDDVARQLPVRNNANRVRPHGSNIDLTIVRNVSHTYDQHSMHTPIYRTMAVRGGRHHYRSAGNGLYSGRGYAGVPMNATIPFPAPVPPQGRPLQHQQILHDSGSNVPELSGHTIGNEACGMMDIAIAAEYGGGQACNTCEPDH